MAIDFTSERFSEDDLRSMRGQIDEEMKARAERRVTPSMKRKYGKYATRVKVRACKGCGREYTARDMRTHPCTISYLNR